MGLWHYPLVSQNVIQSLTLAALLANIFVSYWGQKFGQRDGAIFRLNPALLQAWLSRPWVDTCVLLCSDLCCLVEKERKLTTCGQSWVTGSWLQHCCWGFWVPQAQCHLVPLYLREGRHLRHSATYSKTVEMDTGRRKILYCMQLSIYTKRFCCRVNSLHTLSIFSVASESCVSHIHNTLRRLFHSICSSLFSQEKAASECNPGCNYVSSYVTLLYMRQGCNVFGSATCHPNNRI